MLDGQGFTIDEEIYTFKPVDAEAARGLSRDKLHILLSVDMEKSGYKDTTRHDMDYGMAWIHEYGKGHVFYCGIGHNQSHFWNPVILKFYLAGIEYALGDLKADATPSAKLKDAKIVPGPDMIRRDQRQRLAARCRGSGFEGRRHESKIYGPRGQVRGPAV